MTDMVSTINITCFDIIYAGVPSFPAEGEEVFAKSFQAVLGGGSNATLVNLFRLGIPVSIGTFLGRDTYSQMALAEYSRMGVQPINLYRGDGMPLMISTAVSTAKDRTFISYCEESHQRASDQEAYNLLKGSRMVCINADYPEVNRQLKRDGVTLFFDTGISDGYTLDGMRETLEVTDYFTPNMKEALLLTQKKTAEEALQVLGEYVQTPIIKLDKNGCLLMDGGKMVQVPEISEYRCVDATGAGDAFLAGLMFGVYNHYSVKESVLMGNITGGKAVTGVGCLTAFLSQDELMEKFSQVKYLIG